MSFIEAKNEFDKKYSSFLKLEKSLVPVDGKYQDDIIIKDKNKQPLEEYYKWQFIYALIKSGLCAKDYIGTEIYFPKGNKNSAPIKIDACIFKDKEWTEHYEKWRKDKNQDAVEWLRNNMIAAIEFKKSNNKDIKEVFTSQIKASVKESECDYCLGIYYNQERLYIFQKKNGKVIRYDESRNQSQDDSGVNHLSLELMDGYFLIPSHEQLLKRVNLANEIDRSKRTVNDLDIITGAHSIQITNAISNILRTMDKVGLKNQKGYEIIIQLFALKIFDEKRSDEYKRYLEFHMKKKEIEQAHLLFYINTTEHSYRKLSDEHIQAFIQRMIQLHDDASQKYWNVLSSKIIDWKDKSHVAAISAIVENLQDYSFIKSIKTDIYQLVFYQFSDAFKKSDKCQFLTPIPLIDFLVNVVNPKNGESIIDPTAGIADFLSLSYLNAKGTIDDRNIYGVDNDREMIMLAQLNMLLNGDGNATLRYEPDKGSILFKYDSKGELVELDPKTHKNGNWDNWKDKTKLKKFDVVLTNPPFGEDRSYEVKTPRDKEIIEMYELWNKTERKNTIDLGLVFLENAYRVLDENGRLGIVLSNSILSTGTKNIDPKGFMEARKWIMEHMRIVGIFDLPANVFADAGVNTCILVAYKPKEKELAKLQKDGYEIFSKDIKKVGYEVRTSKRIKYYNWLYKLNETTFEVEQDKEGNPLLDEEFTKVIQDFKEWAKTQEESLQKIFL